MPTRLSPKARYTQRLRYYRRGRRHNHNNGKIWTREDLEAIHSTELSDKELSKKLGRSLQAIQVKRSTWKKQGRRI